MTSRGYGNTVHSLFSFSAPFPARIRQNRGTGVRPHGNMGTRQRRNRALARFLFHTGAALMRGLRILPRYARVFLYAAASCSPSMAAGSSGTRRSIQPAP